MTAHGPVMREERSQPRSRIKEDKAMTKIYNIKITRKGRERIVSNTLENLVEYFSYKLLSGSSYDSRVNKAPKTIKSLMSSLNRAVRATEESCYDQTCYELLD